MLDRFDFSIQPEDLNHFLRKSFQYKAIQQTILQQRLICAVAESKGIAVTPEEMQIEANRVRFERRLEKATDTYRWLTDEGVTPQEWEESLCDRLLADKLAEHLLSREVERQFAQTRLDYEQVILYQLIVADAPLANELFYAIEEAEVSFYEAAHRYDLDADRRRRCGYEGSLYRLSLQSAIESVIFASSPNQVIGPIQTSQGFHLFMVDEFIPATLTDEVRKQIRDRLFQEWLTDELHDWQHNQSG